jgi:hypothetical protein
MRSTAPERGGHFRPEVLYFVSRSLVCLTQRIAPAERQSLNRHLKSPFDNE